MFRKESCRYVHCKIEEGGERVHLARFGEKGEKITGEGTRQRNNIGTGIEIEREMLNDLEDQIVSRMTNWMKPIMEKPNSRERKRISTVSSKGASTFEKTNEEYQYKK